MHDLPQHRLLLWFAGLSVVDERFLASFDRLLNDYLIDSNMKDLIQLGRSHKFAPILNRAMSRLTSSPDRSELESLVSAYRATNAVMIQSLEAIAESFDARGIPFVVLKGIDFLLSLYPAELPRTMDDVDILVRRDDLDKACQVFYGQRYVHGGRNLNDGTFHEATEDELKRQHEDHPYQLYPLFKRVPANQLAPHRDTVERWLADGFYYYANGESVEYLLEYDLHYNVSQTFEEFEAWRNLRSITLPSGRSMLALGPTEQLLVLSDKVYYEVMSLNEMNLRLYIDLLMTVKHFSHEIDWDRCLMLVRHYELETPLFYCLWHANQIVGGIPDATLVSLMPTSVPRQMDYGDFLAKLLGTWACIPTPLDYDGATTLIGAQ